MTRVDMLRHLRFFTAVADARHFGDAARNLGMTQPPLSQGIRRLEGLLGVRLFDRDTRGVRITEAGLSLLPPARDLLRLENEFVHAATQIVLPDRVRVGVAGDLEGLVPTLVGRMVESGWAVSPTVAGSVELIDLLRDGLLDLAVVRHPGVLDGFEAGPVIVIPTRLEPPLDQTAANVDSLPVAVPPRHHQPAAHDQLVDALRRAGHSGWVVESPDADQRRALAAAGTALRLSPVDIGTPHHQQWPPLRLRVVLPFAGRRRSGVDHTGAAGALETALTRR